jgi:hypothetical protein
MDYSMGDKGASFYIMKGQLFFFTARLGKWGCKLIFLIE